MSDPVDPISVLRQNVDYFLSHAQEAASNTEQKRDLIQRADANLGVIQELERTGDKPALHDRQEQAGTADHVL